MMGSMVLVINVAVLTDHDRLQDRSMSIVKPVSNSANMTAEATAVPAKITWRDTKQCPKQMVHVTALEPVMHLF